MDMSFYEDLVGKKFPSPESSGTSGWDSQGGSLNDTSSPKQLESSPASSSSGNFENDAPTSSRQVSEKVSSPLDQEVSAIVNWMEILEDRNSLFNLPLSSVDTSLPIAKRVEQRKTVWPRPMTPEGRPISTTCPPGFEPIDDDAATVEDWNLDPFWTQDCLSDEHERQLRTDGPLPDVFVFPPVEPAAEAPFLNLFCRHSYNLVNSFVSFSVQVHNVPREMRLNAEMFEAVVTTPDGRKVACLVEDVDNFTINSFNCSFWADDDGYYEVRGTMAIPRNIWNVEQPGGTVEGSLDIPVSRNYAEDCQKESLLIRCEYKTLGPATTPAPQSPTYRAARHTIAVPPWHKNNCKLWGLTADLRTNNLFYTDRASHQVVCVHPSGQTLFKFAQPGHGRGSLYRPAGIAFDGEHGRLVIADKDNHRISFFTMEGQFISSFGSKGHIDGTFNYPWDVAVSPDGQRIVVSDSRNKRVQMFDRFGNFLSKYSVFEKSPFDYKTELDYPRGISFDETGKNIYVADFNSHNVVRIPLDFSQHHKMIPEGKLLRPQGIAVDWLGNLLIVDSRNHCVRHVSPQSDLIADIRKVQDKPLDFPVNVATLAGGYVAVLDGAGKIHIF